MTPELLFEACGPALAIVGVPTFAATEEADGVEALRYLPPTEGEPGCWALVPMQGEPAELIEVVLPAGEVDFDEILPLDVLLAAELIKGQLRGCLAARGWQVQMKMARERMTWRLVDCLAITEGGGDRLDDHYPAGDDELGVLCESVVMLSRHGMA